MKRRSYRKKGPFKLKIKRQTMMTVAGIWMWLFSAIMLLSFFGEGTLLTQIRTELSGQIGWMMYGVPAYLVILSLLLFKVKSPVAEPNVPMGLGMMFVGILGLTQTGMVGEEIYALLSSGISGEGAVLIYLTMFVAGLMFVFNASLDRFMGFILNMLHIWSEWVTDKVQAMLTPKEKPFFLKEEKREIMIKGTDGESHGERVEPNLPQKNTQIGKNATVMMTNPTKTELKINDPMKSQKPNPLLWEYPPESLLSDGPGDRADRGDVKKNASTIEKTLDSFGLKAKVMEVNKGPAITQYSLKLALGTKVSKITSLANDLALALAAPTGQIRIEAPIPGRDLVGIEIPNRGLEFVTFKRMISSETMKKAKSKLTVALGLDVSGNPLVADLAKMPHVLVAGTTGSGKSVLINAFIVSLLCRTTPQEVRIIMVDPKRVEMIGYNGIPHLLTPVIVEADKILSALHWAVKEMETRYKQFAEVGVKNIEGFNDKSGFMAMPYIVIFIDELADLMAYAATDVEDQICRIAQMARAVGIHLVLATQSPRVDVITGLIKANVPSRIAFNVSSMIDSRVVIDMPGAEKLLGKGDMLYIPPDQSKPSRIQGTFVSEQEVTKIVDFLKTHNTGVEYTEEVTNQAVSAMKKGNVSTGSESGKDVMFEEAIRIICQYNTASASFLQRKLSIGYARAARLVDQLEEVGAIGHGDGAKPRDVLVKNPDDFLAQMTGN